MRLGSLLDLITFLFSMHVFLEEKKASNFSRIKVSGKQQVYKMPLPLDTQTVGKGGNDTPALTQFDVEDICMFPYYHMIKEQLITTYPDGTESWLYSIHRMFIGIGHEAQVILYTDVQSNKNIRSFSPCHNELDDSIFVDGRWRWDRV